MFQKYTFRSIYIGLLGVSVMGLTTTQTLGQTALDQNSVWDKLSKQQKPRFEAQWQITTFRNPNPKFNVEDYVAQLQGLKDANAKPSPTISKEVLEGQKRFAKALQSGATFTQNLDIVRVGKNIRAEVEATDGVRSSNKFIDFYDGVNAASFVEMNKNSEGVEQQFYQGTVTRLPGEILSHSAPDDLSVLLAEAEVNSRFNAQNSEVSFAKDKVYLKKGIVSQTTQGPRQLGDSTQLVLSAPELRPVALQTTNRKGEVISEFVVEKYQEKEGLTSSSLIVSRNSASDKPGGIKNEYKLLRVAHNDRVDPSKLKLPVGATVGDYRFGNEAGVSYRIKDGGLLSDAEVKKLLGDKAQVPVSAIEGTVNQTPLLLLTGLGLLGFGSMMWRKGASGK